MPDFFFFASSTLNSVLPTQNSILKWEKNERKVTVVTRNVARRASVRRSSQAGCLFDDSGISEYLDHRQQGRLPGERFDAHEQCMLKYGRGSIHAVSQDLGEVCRDLHCQRERYTWTSHPALEGTLCGPSKVSDTRWCVCVVVAVGGVGGERESGGSRIVQPSRPFYHGARPAMCISPGLIALTDIERFRDVR